MGRRAPLGKKQDCHFLIFVDRVKQICRNYDNIWKWSRFMTWAGFGEGFAFVCTDVLWRFKEGSAVFDLFGGEMVIGYPSF